MPARLTIALTLLMAASCQTPRTQVMVVVFADDTVRAMTGPVFVEVRGGSALASLGAGRNQVFRPPPAIVWPMQVPVIPENNDATRVFRVEVRALGTDSTSTIAVVRGATGFVQGETRMLVLRLTADCIGVSSTCSATQTCARGACAEVVFTPPQSLPQYTEHPDGGPPPPPDSGPGVETECTDGVDDDGDDLTDCGDSDCADDPACMDGGEGAPCSATEPCQTGLSCAPAPISRCYRPCNNDTECAASIIPNPFCAQDPFGAGLRFCAGVLCDPVVPGSCPTGQRCEIVGYRTNSGETDLEAATFCLSSGGRPMFGACNSDLECEHGLMCWITQTATEGVCVQSCSVARPCPNLDEPCTWRVGALGPASNPAPVRVQGSAVGACGFECNGDDINCPAGTRCADVGLGVSYCTGGHEGEPCDPSGNCGFTQECRNVSFPRCVTLERPWPECACECFTPGTDLTGCHEDFSTCDFEPGGALYCFRGAAP